MGIYNVVTTLHEARGVDIALRWLLFFSGIIGTLMVATGLILWCVKRAPQQRSKALNPCGYRTVEVTNIAAIIGLPIACAASFYANRLIPAQLENRLESGNPPFSFPLADRADVCNVPHAPSAWLELCLPSVSFSRCCRSLMF